MSLLAQSAKRLGQRTRVYYTITAKGIAASMN